MLVADIWRITNSALAIGAMVWLLIDLGRIYKNISSRRIFLTLALFGFLLTVVVASVEQMVDRIVPGVRTALTSASVIWTYLGLWIGKNDDRSSRPKHGL